MKVVKIVKVMKVVKIGAQIEGEGDEGNGTGGEEKKSCYSMCVLVGWESVDSYL